MNYAEARAQSTPTSAFYSSPIADVVDQASETILGHLAKRNPFALDALQRNAWLSQIDLVRTQLGALEGWVAFEFAIPRMGKRADVVLVTAGIVFVIEFKVGSHQFDAAAFDQVMDYALDLKNFHAGSHDRRIVPIVVATMAGESPFELRWGSDGVAGPIGLNGNNLGKFVAEIVKQTPGQAGLDGEQWSRTGYKPTPTIIEAAQALYQGHRVENITRSDAGANYRRRQGAPAQVNLLRDWCARCRKDIGRSQFGDPPH